MSGCSASCDLIEPIMGRKYIHFKERICARCTSSGILVPRQRIAVLPTQGRDFVNHPTQGMWTQSHNELPNFRVVNQTLGCPGRPLIIFETPPGAEALARFGLMQPDCADRMHLHLCRGTLVPRSSIKRTRPGMDPTLRASHQDAPGHVLPFAPAFELQPGSTQHLARASHDALSRGPSQLPSHDALSRGLSQLPSMERINAALERGRLGVFGHGSQCGQPTFVEQYVSLHNKLATLITSHLLTHESLEPTQRVELTQQLKRSLNVVRHNDLDLLRTWRSAGNWFNAICHQREDTPDEEVTGVTLAAEGAHREEHAVSGLLSSLGLDEEMTLSALSNVMNSRQQPTAIRAVGLPMEVNKQVRQILLHQSKYTNKFRGSELSLHVEKAYLEYVVHTQKPKLARRLVGFALLIPIISLAHSPRTFSMRNALLLLLTAGVPSTILLLAAIFCSYRTPSPKHWQWHVVAAILAADSCNFWADLLIDFAHFTPADKDFHTMWELARFLVMLCACAMAAQCGLQLNQSLALHLVTFAMYVAASMTMYVVWWERSGQGEWVWHISDTSLEGGSAAGAATLNRSCAWLRDHYGTSGRSHDFETAGSGHSAVLLDCIALALIAMVTNVCTLHRLNHSERISFVNSYVLHSKVSEQSQLLTGQRVELLALFSNPWLRRAVPASLRHLTRAQLGPLSLGRELKSLLRTVPSPYVHVEPAATLEDVRVAIQQYNPQIALFSGHSLAGSLAFELPNGSVDLPEAHDLMAALQPANGPKSKLRCLVLNGCDTIELALSLVRRMPALTVVCWRSLAEDAAARAFAAGFYRAIGSDMVARAQLVAVEAAYQAGLSTFEEQGFVYGDPSLYLHPSDHPHMHAPELFNCEGCSPPVHGQPVLLSHVEGEVCVRVGPSPWQTVDGSIAQLKSPQGSKVRSKPALRD